MKVRQGVPGVKALFFRDSLFAEGAPNAGLPGGVPPKKGRKKGGKGSIPRE